VKGEQTQRGKAKKADYVLYYKSNILIAIIETKKNTFAVGSGMQQALDYADILDLPVAFSSNGDGFWEHDQSGYSEAIERELSLDDFPSPDQLWQKYKKFKGIETPEADQIASFDYFFDSKGRQPRYYQQIAINRIVGNVSHLLEGSMGYKRKLIPVDKQADDNIMHHNGLRKVNRLSL